MPSLYGKGSKKKELIKHLSTVYAAIAKEHAIAEGDFPPLAEMQEKLLDCDWAKFNQLNKKLIDGVDKMLKEDIARLMSQIPQVKSSEVTAMVERELKIRTRIEREFEAISSQALPTSESSDIVSEKKSVTISDTEVTRPPEAPKRKKYTNALRSMLNYLANIV